MTANDAGETSGLLPEVAAGDTSAVGKLYDRYSPSIYALLLKILANPDDAQEVLQETFVQAWRRAADYDPNKGSEIAWLVSIARNRGIDRLRSRNLRAEREDDAGREISSAAPIVHSSGDSERLAIVAEMSARDRGALADLPEAQRIALELAYFEGLSQTEISAKLGEPLGTVKTRTQLGMKKLRERLRDLGWFDHARKV